MKITGWTSIRAAASAAPLLDGCVVVPDGGEVHHSG
jgi:hypothetical protein